MPVLKFKKADGTWQKVGGSIITSSGLIAPKLTNITIHSNLWVGENDIYHQVVECGGVNENCKLDLQPTPEQVVELQDEEISLMLTNTNGVVTVYAIGGVSSSNYTMDVLVTEVTVI